MSYKHACYTGCAVTALLFSLPVGILGAVAVYHLVD